ncbi:MAG: hypothetical protein GKR77_02755 [Legionellales bacterium]|nr:hypothetical protein [Legionellales bacterium]
MLRAINDGDFEAVRQQLRREGQEVNDEDKIEDDSQLLKSALLLFKSIQEQHAFLVKNDSLRTFYSTSQFRRQLGKKDNLVDIIYLLLNHCPQTTELFSYVHQYHLFSVLASPHAKKISDTEKKIHLLDLLSNEGLPAIPEDDQTDLLTYAITKKDAELIARILIAIAGELPTQKQNHFGQKTFKQLFQEPWTKILPAETKHAVAACLATLDCRDLIQKVGLADNIKHFYPTSPDGTGTVSTFTFNR